jgi:hypothetical protein
MLTYDSDYVSHQRPGSLDGSPNGSVEARAVWHIDMMG